MKKVKLLIVINLHNSITLKEVSGYKLDFDDDLAIHRNNELPAQWSITDILTGLLVYTSKGTKDFVISQFKFNSEAYKKYIDLKSKKMYKRHMNKFKKLKIKWRKVNERD